MSVSPIVIIGAGGFGREVLALIRDINHKQDTWCPLGFVDDDKTLWGTHLCELPVLGGLDWLAAQNGGVNAAMGIGNPQIRSMLVDAITPHVSSFPTLIHPSVIASRYVRIGTGTIITAGNILTTQVEIGQFVLLNLSCTVGHDSTIGHFSTLSPGVNVSGNVHIGEGCDIGTAGAQIPGVTVGDWSIIGAGAVVTNDLPANCTAVGVPARVIKRREPGWHLIQ